MTTAAVQRQQTAPPSHAPASPSPPSRRAALAVWAALIAVSLGLWAALITAGVTLAGGL